MNDIKEYSGNNLGGILRFRFILSDDVETYGTPDNHRIIEPLQLKTGKYWKDAYATLETIGYTEKPESSKHGEVFKCSFVGVTPQDSPENAHNFNAMRNGKFLVDYTDSNGLRKIIGSIDEPLSFKSSLNTKQKIADRNEHVFEFYATITHKAYVYDI